MDAIERFLDAKKQALLVGKSYREEFLDKDEFEARSQAMDVVDKFIAPLVENAEEILLGLQPLDLPDGSLDIDFHWIRLTDAMDREVLKEIKSSISRIEVHYRGDYIELDINRSTINMSEELYKEIMTLWAIQHYKENGTHQCSNMYLLEGLRDSIVEVVGRMEDGEWAEIIGGYLYFENGEIDWEKMYNEAVDLCMTTFIDTPNWTLEHSFYRVIPQMVVVNYKGQDFWIEDIRPAGYLTSTMFAHEQSGSIETKTRLLFEKRVGNIHGVCHLTREQLIDIAEDVEREVSPDGDQIYTLSFDVDGINDQVVTTGDYWQRFERYIEDELKTVLGQCIEWYLIDSSGFNTIVIGYKGDVYGIESVSPFNEMSKERHTYVIPSGVY